MANTNKTSFPAAPLGRCGLKISAAVMGCMTFGGEADEPESRRIFDHCVDNGISTFDCANVYNAGASEQLLGKFADGKRHELTIATKAYFPTGAGPNDRGASRRHLERAAQASLKRLNTDWIDIYFVHKFDESVPLEETIATLESMVQRGMILYAGVSNFSAWQTQKAHDLARSTALGGLACIQPMYNLLKRQCEVEILPQATSEGIGVMTYSPLAAGLLTGKFQAQTPADPASRLASNSMYQRRYKDAGIEDQLKAFIELCMAHAKDPVHVAIAWVSANKAVSAPILGARTLLQLERQLGFKEVNLERSLLEAIDQIFPPPPVATDRTEER